MPSPITGFVTANRCSVRPRRQIAAQHQRVVVVRGARLFHVPQHPLEHGAHIERNMQERPRLGTQEPLVVEVQFLAVPTPPGLNLGQQSLTLIDVS